MDCNLRELRLCIVDDPVVYVDDNRMAMENPVGLLWTELSSRFNSLLLCSPVVVSIDEKFAGSEFDVMNVTLEPRAAFWGPVELIKQGPLQIFSSFRAIDKAISKSDIVLVRIPSLFSLYAVRCARRHQKKIVLHRKGRWMAASRQDLSFGKRISLGVAAALERKHDELTCAYPTMVMGPLEYSRIENKNPLVVEVDVSLLCDVDYYAKDFLPSDRVKLLFVGRMSLTKGLDVLIEAVCLLDIPFELTIVGDGPMRDEIEQLVKNKEMANSIKIVGALGHGEQLRSIYRSSDIFLLPSLAEGFPKVVYEAAAASLPIVVSDVGEIRSKVPEDSVSFVEAGNVDSLLTAIIDVLSQKQLTSERVQRMYEWARLHSLKSTTTAFAVFISRAASI